MKKTFYTLIFMLLLACNRDKDKESEDTIPAFRTVIVYMAADNDLSSDALADIEEMKAGYAEAGVNLIVFADLDGEAPKIMKIGKNSAATVHTYPEFNSAEATQVQKTLNDIVDMYPAESYGLVLWSHATSWLPAGVRLKSFGEDSGKQMNISELAAALPVHFDFILFDACLMGAVEVAYELKEKADWLIASSAETIYEGFPYDEIVPEMLKSNINLQGIAQIYFDWYDELDGDFRSATVSLVNLREMENLAKCTKQLLAAATFDISTFDRLTVQRLDVYSEQYAFDFMDFIEKLCPEADRSALEAQLAKTVAYRANTPSFIEMFDIDTYCGLSCYIPHPERNDLNEFYRTLKWYVDGGFNLL